MEDRVTSRVHQRLLGLPAGPVAPVTEWSVPERVQVHREARASLLTQLTSAGRWRGGLLFGWCEGEALQIRSAAPQGYAWWLSCQSPLDADPRYAVGWADALAAAGGPPVDWVGSWIIAPDNQVAGLEPDLTWLRAGQRTALFDDLHVLLSVGRREERLSAAAYRWLGDEVEPLDVVWDAHP